MSVEIFFLRHPQTFWNEQKRFQGWKNSGLTEKGIEQASILGRILCRELGAKTNLPLYVSPLGRTIQAAELIQKHISFREVIVEARLKEVSMGDWEGLTLDEVYKGWPQFHEALANYRAVAHAPNGEGESVAKACVVDWYNSLKEPVVAVSHGILGRLLRSHYLGRDLSDAHDKATPQDVVYHLHAGKVDILTLA